MRYFVLYLLALALFGCGDQPLNVLLDQTDKSTSDIASEFTTCYKDLDVSENEYSLNFDKACIDGIISEGAEPSPVDETEVDRNTIQFLHSDALPPGVYGAGGNIDQSNRNIHWTNDPTIPFSWDVDTEKQITPYTAIAIPILIADPKRKCMLENDFTNGDTSFIEPVRAGLLDWHTGQPYTFHSPRWEGQPPPPMVRRFYHVHDGDDLCPRRWFYFARVVLYLKFVEGEIHTRDLGVSIDFENGETLTWNLSEIYPKLPPK